MAITITVTPTDGENKFAITPQAVDGPLGDTNTSDLNMLGMGTKRYGSELNSNLYRLLENFSCPENIFPVADIPTSNQINLSGDFTEVFSVDDDVNIVNSTNNDGQYTIDSIVYNATPNQTEIVFTTSTLNQSIVDGDIGYPGWPQTENTLGRGNGINYPTVGQMWFNTTTSTLLLFDGQKWKYVNNSVASDEQPNKSPEDGDIWYDTANNQLMVYDSSESSWLSVAYQYLRLDGTEPMQGSLDMGSNIIINLIDPSNPQEAATKGYVDNEISSAVNAQNELQELNNVTISSVTDNEALVFDNASGVWINRTISEMNLYDQSTIDSKFDAVYDATYEKGVADITFLNVDGDTITGQVNVQNEQFAFRDTTAAIDDGGLWGIETSYKYLRLLRNTSTAGDFSSTDIVMYLDNMNDIRLPLASVNYSDSVATKGYVDTATDTQTFNTSSYRVTGLEPHSTYYVTVYGLINNRGTGWTTLQPVKVTDSSYQTLVSTPSDYINWPDGHAPHTCSFVVIVPSDGEIRGFTDNGSASFMSGFKIT